MTFSLAEFQSRLGRSLMGEGICPIDPETTGFHFTATVRRSWCEGRTMIAARAVLTLVPDTERRRLVAEYVDAGGSLAMFSPTENAAFLEFLAPRLPDPSHGLSLCRMDQAMTRARSGSETFVPPKSRDIRECIEREAWGYLERAVLGSGEWDSASGKRDIWEWLADRPAGLDARVQIERQAWQCIERAARGPFERGPHASLVWFHAEPEDVLRALHGAPPPPVGDAVYPMLFAPGLPDLYRAASDEEVALWARLPTAEVPPGLLERLLAEGVLVRSDRLRNTAGG